MRTHIDRHVARGNRNLLLTGTAVLLIFGLAAWISRDAIAEWRLGTFGLVSLGGLLAATMLVLGTAVVRLARPGAHPTWRQLARLGDARALAAEIDAQAQARETVQIGRLATVTRSWLLRRRRYGLDCVPLDRIVWVHQKLTREEHLVLGVSVSTRNVAFAAVVRDRDGRKRTISGSEDDVGRLLAALHERAPWIFSGWSEELARAWRRQRAQVVAAADARRQELRSRPGALRS